MVEALKNLSSFERVENQSDPYFYLMVWAILMMELQDLAKFFWQHCKVLLKLVNSTELHYSCGILYGFVLVSTFFCKTVGPILPNLIKESHTLSSFFKVHIGPL